MFQWTQTVAPAAAAHSSTAATTVMTKSSFYHLKIARSDVHVRFRETHSCLHLQQGAMCSCSSTSQTNNTSGLLLLQ